jgi:hypothetical protein
MNMSEMGVAEIFMEMEPLAGKRHAEVTARRTRKKWPTQIKQMLDKRHPDAARCVWQWTIRTHDIASRKSMRLSALWRGCAPGKVPPVG